MQKILALFNWHRIITLVFIVVLTIVGFPVSVQYSDGNLNISKNIAQAAAAITSLGTANDIAATSPWTALTELSITAGDTLVVCDSADAGSSAVSVETFLESADYGGVICALTNDGTYIYAGGVTTQTIRKYLMSDMSYIGESADYGGTILALTNDGTYIYAGGVTTQTIRKYLMSDMSYIGESADYGGIICALTNDGTYVYAGGITTQTIRKYLMSDMSYIGESADYGGTIYALTNDGTYIYAGGYITQTIRKYLMSDMSYIGESADYGGTIRALTNDGTYVYAGGVTTQTIRKYLMSDMSYIGESADYGGTILALTNDGTYIYAGGYITQTVFVWVEVLLICDVTATNAGNVVSNIWSGEVTATSANWSIVITNTSDAKAMTAYKVSELADSPIDKTPSQTGSGTDASSGSTGTLSQADEVVIGLVGMEEEIDEKGTWTTGAAYVSGNEQDGCADRRGAKSITACSVAEIVSATTAQTAEMTGTGGNDWAACAVTYKVAVGEPDISNTPSSEDFGVTNENTTYWAKTGVTPPSFPLTSGNCTFAVTNNSGAAVDIVVKATNFTGGVGATLIDGSPGANTVRMSVYREGDGSVDNTILTTTDRTFETNVADSSTVYWDVKLELGTYSDSVEKTSTITLTASLS